MMTLREAIDARVRIRPGRRVRTFGGWCRHDRVLVEGREIGRIQTRRGRTRTEILTIAGDSFVLGYDVAWLVNRAHAPTGGRYGCDSATAAGL